VEVLSDLDKHVLAWARDDFETPSSIVANVSLDLGRPVTEREVLGSFVRLAQLGLVQAFQYESTARQYSPVSPTIVGSLAEPWFMATASSS